MHLCYRLFYSTLVQGVAYQKQILGAKLEGVWAKAASNKFWDPYLFMQQLMLAMSNFV